MASRSLGSRCPARRIQAAARLIVRAPLGQLFFIVTRGVAPRASPISTVCVKSQGRKSTESRKANHGHPLSGGGAIEATHESPRGRCWTPTIRRVPLWAPHFPKLVPAGKRQTPTLHLPPYKRSSTLLDECVSILPLPSWPIRRRSNTLVKSRRTIESKKSLFANIRNLVLLFHPRPIISRQRTDLARSSRTNP